MSRTDSYIIKLNKSHSFTVKCIPVVVDPPPPPPPPSVVVGSVVVGSVVVGAEMRKI